jgi:hypothetical protein
MQAEEGRPREIECVAKHRWQGVRALKLEIEHLTDFEPVSDRLD